MQVEPTSPDQRRPRLLAIDDSEMIHRLLKARLKSERLEIHSATSGDQGVALAKSLQPDVVLLDIDMPGVDGFAVLRELKSDPLTHEIPVIFLSGEATTEAKIRGLEMGAHDYVLKPFDIGELRARVRSAVRIRLLIKMLAQMAQIDGLTGLWNRTYFDQRLAEETATALRHGTPLSLVLCDLDHFKEVNDTCGHPFGDQVLEEFSRILNRGRSSDISCRYGGEEFAIILPHTAAADAAHVAERYRLALHERTWPQLSGEPVTASFGVTELCLADDKTPKGILALADAALYEAKQSGRDRVVMAKPQDGSMRMSA